MKAKEKECYMMKSKLSFMIPCYRSEHIISSVIEEIISIMDEKADYDYEIITINDDSPDDVLSVLRREAERFPMVKVIDLAKNMGKHAALMAGYSKATGDIIVGVDDDGQCPIECLWQLIKPLEQGFDVSIACYPEKKQSKLKNFGSRVNHWMSCILLEKPKQLQMSNFYAMKRFICKEILRYQNPYPYIDGLILRSTRKIQNVDMEERERVSGSSGYTFRKSLSLWLNGFTAFSVKPLRIATVTGAACAFLGFLCGMWVIIRKICYPEILAGYSSMMALLLFIGGMIMLMLGLIGEYIGRIYISINHSPQYVIREMINIDAEDSLTGMVAHQRR